MTTEPVPPENPTSPILYNVGEAASHIAVKLMNEGERGAVLLGAARLEAALEKLLKSILSPHPDGNDNLFQPDRPLGSFSAKISLAFRLSLIDKPVEHALQMIRKVRNDFAHSFEDESLKHQAHRNRLSVPISHARKNALWAPLEKIIGPVKTDADLLNYILLVVVLVAFIEAVAQLQTEYKPVIPVRF